MMTVIPPANAASIATERGLLIVKPGKPLEVSDELAQQLIMFHDYDLDLSDFAGALAGAAAGDHLGAQEEAHAEAEKTQSKLIEEA